MVNYEYLYMDAYLLYVCGCTYLPPNLSLSLSLSLFLSFSLAETRVSSCRERTRGRVIGADSVQWQATDGG